MSATHFKHEGSSSGRWLYIQVQYSVFYMHQYKHSSTYKTACKTHYTITVYTTVFLEDELSGSKHVEDIKIKN
jgi:hypothetical protein